MIFTSACPTLGTKVKLLFLGLVNPPLTSLLPPKWRLIYQGVGVWGGGRIRTQRETCDCEEDADPALVSHLTSRSVCIFLPRLVYIPELFLIPREVPDFNEQTRVSNGHPGCNSRIYPRFLPHLEKTHETFPSLRDEARFPCIVSRAIAISQSNT